MLGRAMIVGFLFLLFVYPAAMRSYRFLETEPWWRLPRQRLRQRFIRWILSILAGSALFALISGLATRSNRSTPLAFFHAWLDVFVGIAAFVALLGVTAWLLAHAWYGVTRWLRARHTVPMPRP
jgi:hypothetical protein